MKKTSLFIKLLLPLFLFNAINATDSNSEQIFSHIYHNRVWGTSPKGIGSSGAGSTKESTIIYRQFLQEFINKNNIKSVVDLGCGDWEFSQLIDWSGVNYTGYDVVPLVIENNIKQFKKENINFYHADILKTKFPPADLLICKDVLQHLSNDDIKTFLDCIDNYKYCLITNDINPLSSTTNFDIKSGEYRPIDLTNPPFTIIGAKVLTFKSAFVTKQTLLIIRNK